jgi:diguanylate cyclase (GGDEF)-like protein
VPKISLLTRFGVVSLVLLTVLGVVLGVRVQAALRDRTRADAVRAAVVAANVGIKPLLQAGDFDRDFVPLDDARRALLSDAFRSAISPDGIVRFKVWNRQHWIVFSDNERLTGRWFAGNPLIERSFDGEVVSEITDLSAPEELDERDFGRLLAVYVPLRVDATGQFTNDASAPVVGSFEIYLPYEPIAAEIAADARKLYVAIAAGLLVLFVALFRTVLRASRQLRQQAADNRYLSRHDALTGLANRIEFHERAEAAMAASPSGVAVALIDLDRFKDINDTLGHQSGDVVLQHIAKRLETFEHATVVARLGGDEFAVVLNAAPSGQPMSQAHIGEVMASLRALIERPIHLAESLDVEVTGSVGVACSATDGNEPELLLQRADIAMYVAKSGHMGWASYDASHDHHSTTRLALAGEVRRAMANDELFFAYQPKLRLADGRVHGAEALVRWRHPERGLVSPIEWLPAVENTELIGPLTDYLIDLALQQARAWCDNGLPIMVAVNLAARCLTDRTLPDKVARALAAHGLEANALELELTESSLLVDPDAARATLARLHDMGITLAIDDFGTGYASLSYLTTLPVDVVKIDQSFVRDVVTDKQSQAVVRFSLDLARSLGLEVVAEGVEDEATQRWLAAAGCDDIQGYYFSRPQPASDLTPWLVAHRDHCAAQIEVAQ